MSYRIHKLSRSIQLEWTPNPVTGSSALFLWGPRQTGKSFLLRERYPAARLYDLLDAELSAELALRPHGLRQDVLGARPDLVILDEIQKVPALLDEVHWLLENTATRFVLCGSSARKLRRHGHNLLGGRATEFHLLPLTSREIPDLDLARLLNHGALPAHYLVEDPSALLRAYVNAYLKEEIADQAVTRNVPAFARFLQTVALTHGRQLNYANVSRETGVSPGTVRSYFQILEDTLLGFALEPWRKTKKRRLVDTAKFYLFDAGVANYLHPESTRVTEGSDLFGRGFEHFLLNEVRAYLAYRRLEVPLAFWRTHSGFEVDLVAGDMELALEFKASKRTGAHDLRGLRALREENRVRRSILVSNQETVRATEDGIELLPWREFCRRLWDGEIFTAG